ncbi:MAG: HAD-IB family hydrolase [Bacteroidia bacterium]|nr:HAD-IB family hydrolase [Bacteroidia bacterium]
METTFSKEDKKNRSYFAFFDLDLTITHSVSGRELALGAYRRGLMSMPDLTSAILLSLVYKMNIVNPGKAIDKMGGWVKGITTEKMENLCSEVFNDVILPSIYPQIKNELHLHKEANAGLVILSSSLAPVCRKMAEHLGMDDVLCSELEAIAGILTGRPEGAFCFGEEKAVRLKQYCEINNSKLQDAWYYGDSLSDLPALSIVGNPVCINPEKKLEKIARKKGWKIYFWK